VVDDEATIRDVIRRYLERDGFIVREAGDGFAALDALAEALPDLIVLDLMLPGIDGLSLTRQLRTPKAGGEHEAWQRIPIIMLTARGDDTDRIAGLDLGADDYVPKPFNPRELLSRLRAVLRRVKSAEIATRIVVGDLVIDVPGQKVSVGRLSDLALTSFEFRLLVELARRAGRIVRRRELATALDFGEYDPSVDRSLDVHISHLRSKLQDDARDPKRIRTVRGVGYVLVRPS